MLEDLLEDDQPQANETLVKRIHDECTKAMENEVSIKRLELALKDLKAEQFKLTTNVIPELVQNAGFGDIFSLADGTVIKIETFTSGGIPKIDHDNYDETWDRRERAFKELERVGVDSIIKVELGIKFDKGSYEEALGLAETISKDFGYSPVLNKDVHASTLKSALKELLKDGSDVDLDTLGVFYGQRAKISQPKG